MTDTLKYRTELLAPAKDKSTAFAAIDCGADAVYIGAYSFGARQNATNSLEDIKEIVDYAHKFNVKIYVTVNTILTDDELKKAVELVKSLDSINVDAILVQDMGLLLELMKLQLPIQIHMSTQCDNRLPEKIKFFNDIGLSRVVLARELSLNQIKEIHNSNPELELEAFIHGALCVSYSGQCYLSHYIGNRSANRGECAQPCRKKYTVKTDDGKIIAKDIYALCLKDLNASEHIKEMIDTGVFSFKIEGRLKDEGYVKNIVSYYRKELDKYSSKISSGSTITSFSPEPESSFNRGFTDYFLKQRGKCFNFVSPKSQGKFIGKVIDTQKDTIIIDTKEKLNPQDGLCYVENNESNGFLINKIYENKKIYPNKKINIKIGTKIYRNQNIEFEKELLKPTKRQIGVSISTFDGTIELCDEDGTKIQAQFPTSEPAKNIQKMNETFIKQFSKTGESDFYITDIKILSEIPFMPISLINELRRTTFDSLMQKRLKEYKRQAQKPMKFVPFYLKEADYRANVHNRKAKEFYKNCECKIKEMSLEHSMPARSIELMRCKHCIKYALNICKSPMNLILVDQTGKEFPLFFDCKNCEMVVLSER